MIAKASAIQHGQAMTNYATKNNRADIVKTNHLSEGLPPMGMWDEMVLHQSMFKQRYAKKPIELTSIRFELSPSEEEARNWTMEDWRRFLDEFIREIDGISKVNHIGKKNGKAASSVKPTNIANSQYFAVLHRDSKSGIPHLHLVVNRIDMDGNINDVKFIGERAVMTAKAVNQRHGWKDAMDIRQERIAEVTKACMDVLRSMPFFDWDEYADRLKARDMTSNLSVAGLVKVGCMPIASSSAERPSRHLNWVWAGISQHQKSGILSVNCTHSQHLLQLVKDLLHLFQTLPHWTAEIRQFQAVSFGQSMMANLYFLPD